jgi:integrase
MDDTQKKEEMNQDYKIFNRRNGRSYTIRNNRDRFFYPDEWMKFFDKLKPGQKYTFMFLINTGSRINEARHVIPSDVDTERKRIILRVTKVKAKKKEKSPRPRIIPMSSQFSKYIKNKIEKNKILSTPAANIAMKKSLEKAGIKDWKMFSIHNIRKTLETWLMALGVDGLKITAHIGHSMSVAAGSYISADVFSWEEKNKIRMIIGDLYSR